MPLPLPYNNNNNNNNNNVSRCCGSERVYCCGWMVGMTNASDGTPSNFVKFLCGIAVAVRPAVSVRRFEIIVSTAMH